MISRSLGVSTPFSRRPPSATEIRDVSSLTTMTTASVSSLKPIAARCLVPSDLSETENWVRGRIAPAAVIVSAEMMTAPSWKGGVRGEDRVQDLLGHPGVDGAACLRVLVEPYVTLDGDDGADLGAGQLLDGAQDFVHDLAFLEPREDPEHAGLPEARERGPQLRLEHHKGCDRAVLEHRVQDRANEIESEETGNRIETGKKHCPQEDLHGSGALDEHEDAVEQDRDDEDLDEINPPGRDEEELLPQPPHEASATAGDSTAAAAIGEEALRVRPCSIASATASALRTVPTS